MRVVALCGGNRASRVSIVYLVVQEMDTGTAGLGEQQDAFCVVRVIERGRFRLHPEKERHRGTGWDPWRKGRAPLL
jgi:hypothetical protein